MPELSITKTYKDGDVLFAADLNAICDSVETFLNGNNLDSTNFKTSVLNGLAFTGAIIWYGNDTPPTGWLTCDGSEISQTTYAALYEIIGTTFNTGGEGAGNFRVPNFERCAPMGVGGSQISTRSPGTSLGDSGGYEQHGLTTQEMPSHTHDDSPGHQHTQTTRYTSTGGAGILTHNSGVNNDSTPVTGSQTATAYVTGVGSTGFSGGHNNIQPSLISHFIIKT